MRSNPNRTLGLLVCISGLVTLAACTPTMIPLELKIKAADQHKQRLADVQIYANGKLVGVTDQKGLWQGTYLAPIDADTQVRLSKQSSAFYFGSYENRIRVSPSMARKIEIDAKLAAIKRTTNLAAETNVANTEPAVVPEAAVEVEAPSIDKALSAYIYDVPVGEITAVASQPALAAAKSSLTIYSFSGQRQLPGVEIRVHPESGFGDPLSCTTNAQGRCLLPLKGDMLRGTLRVAARRAGMQTVLSTMPAPADGLLQVDMTFGQSIDLRAVEEKLGKPVGLARVPVFINANKIGETDAHGYFSLPSSAEGLNIQELALEREDLLPKRRNLNAVVTNGWNILRFATRDLKPTTLHVRPVTITRSNLTQIKMENDVAEDLVGALAQAMLAAQSLTLVDEASAQYLIQPHLEFGETITANLSITSNDGKTVAHLTMPWQADQGLTARGVNSPQLASIAKLLPFDAAIADLMNDEIVVEIPSNFHTRVKVGDSVDVYALHNPQLRSGSATISEVWQDLVKLKRAAGQANFAIGDMVRFNAPRAPVVSPARQKAFSEIALDSIPSGATVYVGNSDQPLVTPVQIKIDPNASETVLRVEAPGYHAEVINVTPAQIMQPGGAAMLIKLNLNRVAAALALVKKGTETAKAEDILAQSQRGESDYAVSRIVLAGLYGESMEQPHKGILELDRLVEQAGILNLNDTQLFVIELDRAILQLKSAEAIITNDNAAAKSLLLEAQATFSRLAQRTQVATGIAQATHSLAFYRTRLAQTLAAVDPSVSTHQQAQVLLGEYEEKFAAQPEYANYLVTVRGYRVKQPVASSEQSAPGAFGDGEAVLR